MSGWHFSFFVVCVFLSFPRILGVLRREKPLLSSGFPLPFSLKKKKQGLEGSGLRSKGSATGARNLKSAQSG